MEKMTRSRRWAALVLITSLAACGKTSAPAPSPSSGAPAAPAEAPEQATAPEASAPAGGAASGFKTAEEGPQFFVYKDKADPSNHFIPSGFMGDGTAITVDDGYSVKPHSGTTCMKWTYDMAQKKEGWAGVVWQDPENNWQGEEESAGYNLMNAKTVKFWARGENGGEVLKFGFGGCPGKFGDTGKKEIVDIKLTKEWQEFEVTADKDMQRIVSGFLWAAAAKSNTGAKVSFYLDDIRYEL